MAEPAAAKFLIGRILKWLAIAVAILVAALVVVSLALPRYPVVARTIDIATPPATVYGLVSDLRRFNEWSPWYSRDPQAVYTFTGPVDGVGQTLNWESKNPDVGSGKMEITKLEPDKEVDTALDFGGAGRADASIGLAPSGTGTRVVWEFTTDLGFNPVARYMGLMFDRWIGPDYEAGLAKLKSVAEAQPKAG